MNGRPVFVGTVVLVIAQCLLFVWLVAGGWAFRDVMLQAGDPEVAAMTRTVFANALWLAVNLIGLMAYVYRKEGIGRPIILFVLTFDILNSLFAAGGFILRNDSLTAVEWFVVTVIPVAALVLVLLKRRSVAVPSH